MASAIWLPRCFEKLRFATPELHQCRSISLSATHNGKRNFRKFSLGNKRGTRFYKQQREAGMWPDMPFHSDVKPVGYLYGTKFVTVPEMIPELVVPNLEDCNLKPYVSYRTPNIAEDPFTAQSLFNSVYSQKIEFDFRKGKLQEDGQPTELSEEEKLSAEEAFARARMTGSDMRNEREIKHWECLDIKLT